MQMGSTLSELSKGTYAGAQPLLSVIVPAYNSQDYLDRCLRTLTGFGKELEIIIVDDGSTDQTGIIAHKWADLAPQAIRVIHQDNAGHGGALNAGIHAANGMYIKIVDSDDWLSRKALRYVLEDIRSTCALGDNPDLIITNYVYEKQGRGLKTRIRYRNVLPVERTVTWDSLGTFRYSQYLMMHALMYRTDVLRRSKLVLPEHTFYVDFLYSFTPLPFVRSVRFIDVDLYRYFIGRGDQSVNEQVMVTRTDQFERVAKGMLHSMPEAGTVPARLYRYLVHYLRINVTILSVMLLIAGDSASMQRRERFWQELSEAYPTVYAQLRNDPLGLAVSTPGRIGEVLSLTGYRIASRVVGFN